MERSEIISSIAPKYIRIVAWPPSVICPSCKQGVWWSPVHMGCGLCEWMVTKREYIKYWDEA